MTQKSPTSESIKAKLTNLAQTLDRDFFGLSLEFAIERLVARLQTDTKLAKHVIFKGGFVMLKCYGSNRTTIDLDTSVHGIAIEEAVELSKKAIEAPSQDGLWMGAIEIEDMDHQTEYHGKRLTLRFNIGVPHSKISALPKIILDIGVADVITPAPQQATIAPLIQGEPISWMVYPLETIAAEKLHALVSHGAFNSRVKDVYDLTVLIPRCTDKALLKNAIERTFKHRSTEIPESFADFWKSLDKTNFKRSFAKIETSSGEVPSFEELSKKLEFLLKD